MFKILWIFYGSNLVFNCCYGFKVHFEHEDTWEDNEELLRETQYRTLEVIFPGTKWCGSGNIAGNESDLGSSPEADACCRTHDLCPDIIEAGQTKHNLTNHSFYTRLNCDCDEEFYMCLKKAATPTARAIGILYFNVLGTQCYQYDYPIVNCTKYHRILKTRCIEYKFDENSQKVWEWFDVPPY